MFTYVGLANIHWPGRALPTGGEVQPDLGLVETVGPYWNQLWRWAWTILSRKVASATWVQLALATGQDLPIVLVRFVWLDSYRASPPSSSFGYCCCFSVIGFVWSFASVPVILLLFYVWCSCAVIGFVLSFSAAAAAAALLLLLLCCCCCCCCCCSSNPTDLSLSLSFFFCSLFYLSLLSLSLFLLSLLPLSLSLPFLSPPSLSISLPLFSLFSHLFESWT